jgi:hypothetical protein
MSQNAQNSTVVCRARDRAKMPRHPERSPILKAKFLVACQECHIDCTTVSSHTDGLIFNICVLLARHKLGGDWRVLQKFEHIGACLVSQNMTWRSIWSQ